MTAKQRRVLRLLRDSDTLSAQADFLITKRTTYGIHGEGDDVAVSLSWRDNEECIWAADFSEDSLQNADLSHGKIRLTDMSGETVTIESFRRVRRLR